MVPRRAQQQAAAAGASAAMRRGQDDDPFRGLPAAVRSAIARLPAAADRVLQPLMDDPAAALPSSSSQRHQQATCTGNSWELVECLRFIATHACADRMETAAHCALLVRSGPARDALLRLVASSVRDPGTQAAAGGEEEEDDQVAEEWEKWDWRTECCALAGGLLVKGRPRDGSPVPPELLVFARALLRGQTLHACARQLAAAAEALQQVGPSGGGGGRDAEQVQDGAVRDEERGDRAGRCKVVVAASARTLGKALQLAYGVVTTGAAELAVNIAAAGKAPPAATLLFVEVAAALRESAVLEHAGRTLCLLLVLLPRLQLSAQAADAVGHAAAAGRRASGEPAATALGKMLDTSLVDFVLINEDFVMACRRLECDDDRPARTAAAALRQVLSGRCFQHAVLLYSVAALCEADGGPTYGLPHELLLCLPVLVRDVEEGTSADTRRGGSGDCSSSGGDGGRSVGKTGEGGGGSGAEGSGERDQTSVGGRCSTSSKGSSSNLGGAGACNRRLYFLQPGAFLATMNMLRDGTRVTPPPPGRQAALALVLRMGQCAVASGQCAASTAATDALGAVGGGGGGVGGGRASRNGGVSHSGDRAVAVLALGHAAAVAVSALNSARSLLDHWPHAAALAAAAAAPGPADAAGTNAGGSGGSRRYASAVTDWWRLTVGVLQHAMREANDTDRTMLREELAVLVEVVQGQRRSIGSCENSTGATNLWLQAAAPPLEVSAALSAGLLPCLERLLRRAGEAPQGPDAALLCSLFNVVRTRDEMMMWDLFAPLLACAGGEGREAAAFVASLGKALRVLTISGTNAAGIMAIAARQLLVGLFRVTVRQQEKQQQEKEQQAQGVAGAGAAGGPGGGGVAAAVAVGRSSRQQQLGRVLSYAVAVLLPPMSRMALQALRIAITRLEAGMAAEAAAATGGGRHRRAGGGGGGRGGAGGRLCDEHLETILKASTLMSDAVLCWIPLLLRQRRPLHPTGESSGGGVGDSGWLLLLLEGVGVVPLIGAALQLAQLVLKRDGQVACTFVWCVLESCAAVAEAIADTAEAAAQEASGVGPRGAAGADGGGATGDQRASAAAVAAAAALPAAWPLPLLHSLASQLRSCGAADAASSATAAETLAEWMAAWGDGLSVDGGSGIQLGRGQGQRQCSGVRDAGWWRRWSEEGAHVFGSPRVTALAALLLPPAEARRLLRTCANPGCVNLAGDSEAGLALQACAGCGGSVSYCGRECQVAHWRAGHRAACCGGGGGQRRRD